MILERFFNKITLEVCVPNMQGPSISTPGNQVFFYNNIVVHV